MESTTQAPPVSTRKLWTGRVLSTLAILFLVMDGVMKLVNPVPVVEGMNRLGYPLRLTTPIGIILLLCVLFYAIPRTSILGAILLTGYLGGAVASQLRIGEPLFSHVLFPVYFGILIWVGLYLRDHRLRALVPLTIPAPTSYSQQ
jgi:DoxX-like protein